MAPLIVLVIAGILLPVTDQNQTISVTNAPADRAVYELELQLGVECNARRCDAVKSGSRKTVLFSHDEQLNVISCCCYRIIATSNGVQ